MFGVLCVNVKKSRRRVTDLFSLLALYVDEEHASAGFKGVVGVYGRSLTVVGV